MKVGNKRSKSWIGSNFLADDLRIATIDSIYGELDRKIPFENTHIFKPPCNYISLVYFKKHPFSFRKAKETRTRISKGVPVFWEDFLYRKRGSFLRREKPFFVMLPN